MSKLRLKWNVVEDWWGCKASTNIAGIEAKAAVLDDTAYFSILHDERKLTSGHAKTLDEALHCAETAIALIFKAKRHHEGPVSCACA